MNVSPFKNNSVCPLEGKDKLDEVKDLKRESYDKLQFRITVIGELRTVLFNLQTCLTLLTSNSISQTIHVP